MNYSLNEVETTAKKAARGAGYPWGLAEEAGKAVRWLCAQGLEGCAELSALLDAGFSAALSDHAPGSLTGVWQGNAPLCPLVTGAALSDIAFRIGGDTLELNNVAHPLLLLPFAAAAATRLGTVMILQTNSAHAATDGKNLHLEGTFPASASGVFLSTGTMPAPIRSIETRATPDGQAWEQLNRYAHRTYAPATEESRLLGAGAGLSDND